MRRFLPFAHSLARRYSNSAVPLDALEQVAALGLIKSIDRFDPERGFAFTSFAAPTILGELRRHFRGHAWVAHVPRSTGRVLAVRQGIEEISAASTPLSALQSRESQSLDAPPASGGRSPGTGGAPGRRGRGIPLRFRDQLTQWEIGNRLGISQMQISRILRAALERLQVIATHQARPSRSADGGEDDRRGGGA